MITVKKNQDGHVLEAHHHLLMFALKFVEMERDSTQTYLIEMTATLSPAMDAALLEQRKLDGPAVEEPQQLQTLAKRYEVTDSDSTQSPLIVTMAMQLSEMVAMLPDKKKLAGSAQVDHPQQLILAVKSEAMVKDLTVSLPIEMTGIPHQMTVVAILESKKMVGTVLEGPPQPQTPAKRYAETG